MMKKPKLVVLSGAGISAESGLATFRGSDGLWEGHRIEDVATPGAWKRNPEMVLEFYNQRRKAALAARPNAAHLKISEWESWLEVSVITQNVDHLHEAAGSSKILHLHGQLFQSRSTLNENAVFPVEGWALNPGDLAPDGSQLRPNIVWFGESVPMMDHAIEEAESADAFLVVGTSLQVYPAASLIDFVPVNRPVFVVDPGAVRVSGRSGVQYFPMTATSGLLALEPVLKTHFGLI
jgi:NAD-dependent deacetylase